VLKVFNSDIFRGAAVEAITPIFQAWQSKKIMLAPAEHIKSFSQDATALKYSIHGMTGVDKLHAAGILGKGVVIAVVDTGVDYDLSAVSPLSTLNYYCHIRASLILTAWRRCWAWFQNCRWL